MMILERKMKISIVVHPKEPINCQYFFNNGTMKRLALRYKVSSYLTNCEESKYN